MEAFRHALERGQVTDYQKLDHHVYEKPAGNVFTRWLVRLLGREMKSDPQVAYHKQSVADHLAKDYGGEVSRKVMHNAGNKPLTARRIVLLHNKAIRLKDEIELSNSRRSNKWLNLEKADSMASKLFTSHYGFSPKDLPGYERRYLQEHLRQAMYQEGDHKLRTREARNLVNEVIVNHRSAISESARETMKLVGRELTMNDGEAVYLQQFGQWLNETVLNTYDKEYAQEFAQISWISSGLQCNSPFDRLDQSNWETQLKDAKNHRNRIGNAVKALEAGAGVSFSEEMRQGMVLDLYRQLKGMNDHIQFLEHLFNADFRGQEQQRKLEANKLNTALIILDTDIEKKERRLVDYPSRKLSEQIDGMKDLREVLLYKRDALPRKKFPSYLFMKKAVKEDIKQLQRDLRAVGVSSAGLNKRWKKTAAAVSNSLSWEVISKTLPLRSSQETRLYQSEQIPAGQMRLHAPRLPAGHRDPFPVSYLGSGRSSADQSEKIHAVNLYETKLVNSEGKELFSGVRSGLLLPYKAKTTREQEEGLENRARELLSAAFTHKFSHLSEEEQNRILAGVVMPMDFVTTSLLSPDKIRSGSGLHDDELVFQQKQNQILQQLCAEQPLVLEVKDSMGNTHLVNTEVRLASMNIPVNFLGLNDVASTVGQTWKSSDSYNDSGMEVLLGYPHPDADLGGMVQDWMHSSGASEAEKNIVRQLADQCRVLYSQKKHHCVGYDAYKFVERLQLLSFKIGAECHFGCKSGKDRTGEADARIKVLAAEVDRLGYVPDPLAPPDREHREAVQTFLYGAGEIEIQLQNVNLPGYKTSYGEEEQGKALYRILH